MQVLVALAQANGGIVGRDELIARCWHGRIVGDNSINRVISLLRQMLDRVGGDSYVIETVTKVGYRLTTPGRIVAPGHPITVKVRPEKPDRRHVVAALAGVTATTGLATAGWLWRQSRPSARRDAAMPLYKRGLDLQRQGFDDGEQSIIYFDRAVRADPDFTEAWGALALARARLAPPGDAATPGELQRVRSAAARALALDASNNDATLALVIVAPYWRNWDVVEHDARAALQAMPDVVLLHAKLGSVLSHVGRLKEGVTELSKAVEREPLVPAYNLFLWRALWGAGRVADAQSLIDHAWERWSDSLGIWVARFMLLAFCGNVSAMVAMSQRGSAGRSDANPLPIELGLKCARALSSADDIAKRSAAAAVNSAVAGGALAHWLAIPFLSALGAVDLAFGASFEFYFGERDALTGERELASNHDPRMTFQLFCRRQPRCAPIRAFRNSPPQLVSRTIGGTAAHVPITARFEQKSRFHHPFISSAVWLSTRVCRTILLSQQEVRHEQIDTMVHRHSPYRDTRIRCADS